MILDSTIVTTLTSTITAEMKSSSVISWLGASYLIATALVQPLCGQLADVYKRRNCFLVGSLVFLVGNAICTATKSLGGLVAGRALSGVGGGILTIMPTIILTDVTLQKERGLWQGINNIVFGLGHGLGGTFGGLMAHHWSWRVAFLWLIPPTFILIVGTALIPEPTESSKICSRTVHSVGELPTSDFEELPLLSTRQQHQKEVDIAGATLLCIGLGLLLISTNQLSLEDSIASFTMNIFLLVLSSISLVLFTYHSLFMAREPILPLRLLAQFSSVGSLCLITFFSQFGFTFAEFYLPLLFSLQEHARMELVGWCLVPLSGGAAAGSFFAGVLLSKLRIRSPHMLLSSSALVCLATIGLPYLADEESTRILQLILIFVWGVGFGGLATVSLVRLLECVQTSTQASATSLLYTSRSLGGAISLPIASLVFDTIRRYRFETLLVELAKSNDRDDLLQHIHRLVQTLLSHEGEVKEIPNTWIPYLHACTLESLAFLFTIPLASGLVLFLVSILIIFERTQVRFSGI